MYLNSLDLPARGRASASSQRCNWRGVVLLSGALWALVGLALPFLFMHFGLSLADEPRYILNVQYWHDAPMAPLSALLLGDLWRASDFSIISFRYFTAAVNLLTILLVASYYYWRKRRLLPTLILIGAVGFLQAFQLRKSVCFSWSTLSTLLLVAGLLLILLYFERRRGWLPPALGVLSAVAVLCLMSNLPMLILVPVLMVAVGHFNRLPMRRVACDICVYLFAALVLIYVGLYAMYGGLGEYLAVCRANPIIGITPRCFIVEYYDGLMGLISVIPFLLAAVFFLALFWALDSWRFKQCWLYAICFAVMLIGVSGLFELRAGLGVAIANSVTAFPVALGGYIFLRREGEPRRRWAYLCVICGLWAFLPTLSGSLAFMMLLNALLLPILCAWAHVSDFTRHLRIFSVAYCVIVVMCATLWFDSLYNIDTLTSEPFREYKEPKLAGIYVPKARADVDDKILALCKERIREGDNFLATGDATRFFFEYCLGRPTSFSRHNLDPVPEYNAAYVAEVKAQLLSARKPTVVLFSNFAGQWRRENLLECTLREMGAEIISEGDQYAIYRYRPLSADDENEPNLSSDE